MTSILVSVFSNRMPTKGKYIAGKQVSRWEADTDNVDIEYKNLDTQSIASVPFFSGRKGCLLKILFLLVFLSAGMILGYMIRRNIHETLIKQEPPVKHLGIKQNYNDLLRQKIQADLNDTANYKDHLNEMSRQVMLSGIGTTNKFIEYLIQFWSSFPLDSVKMKQYSVLLSYRNYTSKSSSISVLSTMPNTSVVFQAHYNHDNMSGIHPDYIPFNAYSPSGFVRSKLIYANYGCKKDFSRLKKLNVTVKKNVILVKYGKIHPANKVLHAQNAGAAGVILYPDPADYANGQSIVYPKTWWLPGWAVPLSHVRYNLVGDPQTPGYPAINGAPHTLSENANYPKIPVQPIGYDDARYLMSQLGGQTAPDDWRGCLNVSYKTGPGFSDDSLQLELDVNNVIERRNISNVIAVIDGKYEKDKFVIIGAHTDSWTKGGVDHATGYSVIWELARGFSALVRDGWRPRRTIMLALWDASKYGHIGSFEWVQEYEKMLGRGAVAYINLDSVIRGNYSFHAEANPLLYSIIKNSTQKVPCTDPDYYDKSVYDMWLERFMDPGKPSQPKINPLNGDSDHTPFEYYLGVPSVSPMYTFNSKIYPHLPTYPAFSTLEDDKEYVETFLDKDTKLEQTVTKIVADMVLLLADSAVLPFDVQNYAQVFDRGKKFLRENEAVISSANVDINVLYSKIDIFIEATKLFAFNVTSINLDSLKESDLYLINDKLLELPRIFINYQGIPGYPQYRHLLLAPHAENLWDDQIFPGIAVTIDQCGTNKDCDPLRHQIALLIVSVHQAIEIIQDEIFIRYS
ncbi:N-acetylated-alpha-linked acidic dipeptidase 2-like isoform X3 [Mytilus californianus]|uniref:N-acetylated-alpha-linked acidic dipeptidase 2-like isoform X1 n=2 Tax=Mytilus californianus TaxID=6549 RepID=UPI002248503E|nr:N-acetylated-alpha-linked acidic dipeptidase 2-like isoform X1 [Mytilus californianus]XP_052102907.1 N-acetylated-alpha-linked acidic dipeptidase 2-like isoform X2 [Mytilus californianus]XP_052102908.1 N-acetylated-alpha-linked acidic dipeptidase 2-like isoform X3 [Mytilus californianus]